MQLELRVFTSEGEILINLKLDNSNRQIKHLQNYWLWLQTDIGRNSSVTPEEYLSIMEQKEIAKRSAKNRIGEA